MAAKIPLAILAASLLHSGAAFRAPSAGVLSTIRRQDPSPHSHRPLAPSTAAAGRTSPPTSTALHGLFDDDDEAENDSAIPPELREEIYKAEANTAAAQGRQVRVVTYILLTLAGVTTAFFNAFLSDLRFGEGSPSTDLAYYGFGWVKDNFLLSFLFTNKIGGGLGLLGAGLSGTLAEVEIRSKKENAVKIWAEMQRRKSLSEQPRGKKRKGKRSLAQASKRDMTGKQKKRLSALEELMDDEAPEPTASMEETAAPEVAMESKGEEAPTNEAASEDTDKDGGLLGKIKGFYDKADSMAASQALLLNKELEDRGIVEKITDETGLRVVGKEAAAQAAAKKETEGEAGAGEK